MIHCFTLIDDMCVQACVALFVLFVYIVLANVLAVLMAMVPC